MRRSLRELNMGMDRRIKKSRKPLLIKLALVAVLGSGAAFAGYRLLQDSAIATFRVAADRVTVAAVGRGYFEDFIPVRGSVTPLKTIFLDAIEGGRVEQVFVEAGAFVHAGQPLLELSNTTLQLDVISREAQVAEQLNNLRNTRLAMEQNRLSLQNQLVELDYQIVRAERLEMRRAQLLAERLISQQEYDDIADELHYLRRKRDVTIESQQVDERMRQVQIEALESNIDQLERNLDIARQNLDSLVLKAPMDGQLSSFDAEIGQSKSRGERLGQIDDVDRFKLEVLIDEFYVTRTQAGQYAEFTLSGQPYELQISKVYPEIQNGQFKVDMAFVGSVPPDIRRGQTLQVRVQLGDSTPALLLARGGFFQDTGGNWAFVLDPAGGFALRRDIRLGRRNPEYFEVLEGLREGEEVLVSEYAAFSGMDRIVFE